MAVQTEWLEKNYYEVSGVPAEVKVPTLDGSPVTFRVPPRTPSGKKRWRRWPR